MRWCFFHVTTPFLSFFFISFVYCFLLYLFFFWRQNFSSYARFQIRTKKKIFLKGGFFENFYISCVFSFIYRYFRTVSYYILFYPNFKCNWTYYSLFFIPFWYLFKISYFLALFKTNLSNSIICFQYDFSKLIISVYFP